MSLCNYSPDLCLELEVVNCKKRTVGCSALLILEVFLLLMRKAMLMAWCLLSQLWMKVCMMEMIMRRSKEILPQQMMMRLDLMPN